MTLSNRYITRLRFKLDINEDNDQWNILCDKKQWLELKKICETINKSDKLESFITKWQQHIVLNSNIIIKKESFVTKYNDLCGCASISEKQIFFRYSSSDNDIIFRVDNSDNEKWSYQELDQLFYSFKAIANTYITDNHNICGFIERQIE